MNDYDAEAYRCNECDVVSGRKHLPTCSRYEPMTDYTIEDAKRWLNELWDPNGRTLYAEHPFVLLSMFIEQQDESITSLVQQLSGAERERDEAQYQVEQQAASEAVKP